VTYALAGLCRRTGELGACVATADVAVGSRVPFVEAGVGAVLTQHRTDPRLGPRGLALLRDGLDAPAALAALVASTPLARWRQLAIVDAEGRTAAFSGSEVVTTMAERHGPGCVAIGNVLSRPEVCDAMVAAFGSATAAGEPLAEALVRALEAGRDAGGEQSPARSSALVVARDPDMRLVDLRIDTSDEPVAALRALWDAFAPWAEELRLRALDPDAAEGIPQALREGGGDR
jgi:uncharacterized Ntn-hydrolase superfamily protein